MTNKLLSVQEAAGRLGCNPKTVYRLAKRADFPALRVGEKRIAIPSNLLENRIENKAREPLD